MGWGTTGLFTQHNQNGSPVASDATTKLSSPSQKDDDSDCPAEKPSKKKNSGKGVTVQLSQHLLQTPPRKTAFRADAPEFVPGTTKEAESPTPAESSRPDRSTPPRSLRLSEMECLVTPTCKALQRLKEMNTRQVFHSEAVETSRQFAEKRALLLKHRSYVLSQPEVKTPCFGLTTHPVAASERAAPGPSERHSSSSTRQAAAATATTAAAASYCSSSCPAKANCQRPESTRNSREGSGGQPRPGRRGECGPTPPSSLPGSNGSGWPGSWTGGRQLVRTTFMLARHGPDQR